MVFDFIFYLIQLTHVTLCLSLIGEFTSGAIQYFYHVILLPSDQISYDTLPALKLYMCQSLLKLLLLTYALQQLLFPLWCQFAVTAYLLQEGIGMCNIHPLEAVYLRLIPVKSSAIFHCSVVEQRQSLENIVVEPGEQTS